MTAYPPFGPDVLIGLQLDWWMWLYPSHRGSHPVVHRSTIYRSLWTTYREESSHKRRFQQHSRLSEYHTKLPASTRSIERVTRNDNQEAISDDEAGGEDGLRPQKTTLRNSKSYRDKAIAVLRAHPSRRSLTGITSSGKPMEGKK